MRHSEASNKVFWAFIIFSGVVFAGTTARAECRPPASYVVRNFVNPQQGSGSVHIRVHPRGFTLDQLVCLAQSLKEQNREWRDVVVLMFGSEEAAESFDPSGMAEPLTRKELRAVYSLNSETHEEYLMITPLGMDGIERGYSTRIDFPPTFPIHCRLEMSGRCLMVLESLEYPMQALEQGISGSVTLGAFLDRAGSTSGVKALSPGAGERNQAVLTSAAVANLKNWWFEPADRQDRIRITYSYVIDTSLPVGRVEVQFGLPNQITIRANPGR